MTNDEQKWARRQQAYRRRKRLRDQAVAYKGGRCCICGYVGLPSIIDFHHLDPRTKDFNISQRVTSFKDIQGELDKCVLLCSRCHREVHEGLHPTYLIREDQDIDDFVEPIDDGLTFEEEQEVLELLSKHT